MYGWKIYYISPLTRWHPEAYPSEIIAEGRAPWLWLARSALMSLYRQLDASRCAYVLLHGEVEIETHAPPIPGSPKPVPA